MIYNGRWSAIRCPLTYQPAAECRCSRCEGLRKEAWAYDYSSRPPKKGPAVWSGRWKAITRPGLPGSS